MRAEHNVSAVEVTDVATGIKSTYTLADFIITYLGDIPHVCDILVATRSGAEYIDEKHLKHVRWVS